MRVSVTRDACCAQDDQIGPLEMSFELNADATLADLVRAVVSSKFLQYSASHVSLTGFIDESPVVAVPSEYYVPGASPVFLVSSSAPLAPLIKRSSVSFRFL
jgi:hypothetical protein